MFPKKGLIKLLAESLFGLEARLAKTWASGAHKRLLAAQWSLKPTPEWFDHSIDLFHLWPKANSSLWLERGIFSGLALKGENVLELSCGDGFNTKHFYAHRSKKVIACDFDPTAIRAARSKNPHPNVEYVLADIRTEMPKGQFRNIVWDAAIAHFTPEEVKGIMENIRARLAPDGILSGYTIVVKADGTKQLPQHEYEFKDMADLKKFLTPYFQNVKVFETIYPERHNLYFWASNGVLPFDASWPHAL
jgi:SAM-dependent methyltransferase